MDVFAFHPYPESSAIPPTSATRVDVDRDRDYPKLVALLGEAFDGTGRAADRLRRVRRPVARSRRAQARRVHRERRRGARRGRRGDAGRYYAQAIELAACQPTVKGSLFFHVTTSRDLDRWQSRRLLRGRHAEVEPRAVRSGSLRARAPRRRARYAHAVA